MRVFVTGSDGYIGTILCSYLLDRGIDVVGCDSGYYRSGWLYNYRGARPLTITKDTRDLTPEDLAGFDAVAHLAELSNDPLGAQNAELTYQINHRASVALLEAARRAGVAKFIYMSSCSVYGFASGDKPVNESSSVNPQTTYAECKVLVEQRLQQMASSTFAPVALRNATAYGASPRQRFDIVLNDLCALAWTKREIALLSDGKPWRPLVHIRDISEAIYQCLLAPADTIAGQVINVGSNEQNYTVLEIAEIVAAEFEGCRITTGDSKGDNRSYRVNFDKIKTILPEFSCRWTAQTGAHELHDLFKSTTMAETDYRAAPFTRLRMLDHLKRSGALSQDLVWRPLAAPF